jgi:hypothetical protein
MPYINIYDDADSTEPPTLTVGDQVKVAGGGLWHGPFEITEVDARPTSRTVIYTLEHPLDERGHCLTFQKQRPILGASWSVTLDRNRNVHYVSRWAEGPVLVNPPHANGANEEPEVLQQRGLLPRIIFGGVAGRRVNRPSSNLVNSPDTASSVTVLGNGSTLRDPGRAVSNEIKTIFNQQRKTRRTSMAKRANGFVPTDIGLVTELLQAKRETHMHPNDVFVTKTELRTKFPWNVARTNSAIDTLIRSGDLMVDAPLGCEPRYYLTSVHRSSFVGAHAFSRRPNVLMEGGAIASGDPSEMEKKWSKQEMRKEVSMAKNYIALGRRNVGASLSNLMRKFGWNLEHARNVINEALENGALTINQTSLPPRYYPDLV